MNDRGKLLWYSGNNMSNSRVFFYRSLRHEKAGRKVSFEKTAFQRAKERKIWWKKHWNYIESIGK
jgi:hypothetical protein